jgi:hypothetical protein
MYNNKLPLQITENRSKKHTYLFFLVILTMAACNTPDQNKDKEKLFKTSELQLGPVRHDTLSTTQLADIRKIQQVFAGVYPASLDETITNFKRDAHPDGEIAVWLTMATAYEKFIALKGLDTSFAIKKEAFELILLRSMMPEEEAKTKATLKVLSVKDVQTIFKLYDNAPKPLTVE